MSYIQELYTDFRAFPRTIKFFYATDILFGFAQAIFSTLFNLHLLSVGFTAGHIGQLQSLSSLLTAALAIPVGLVADKWGRRWLYVTGSILFGVPFLVMPWLTSFPWLMAVYVVYTLGNTLMFVNESPLLAGEVGPDRRASVFSFMMINYFVWNTLGIQLAGFLVNWLPAGPLSVYQWPLMCSGVSAIGAGLARGLLPFKPHKPPRKGLNLRPTRTTLTLGLVSLLVGSFSVLLVSFNNVILSQRFQYGSEAISSILTVGGIVGWIGSLLVPWTSRRLGNLKAYALILGIQGLVLIFLGFAATPALFLTGYWARSVVYTMQMSIFNALSMGVTPEAERATANSYAMLGRNLGTAAAAKVFGGALTMGNYLLSFSLAGALAICAAAVTLLAFRRQDLFAGD
jgi:MFS family permease